MTALHMRILHIQQNTILITDSVPTVIKDIGLVTRGLRQPYDRVGSEPIAAKVLEFESGDINFAGRLRSELSNCATEVSRILTSVQQLLPRRHKYVATEVRVCFKFETFFRFVGVVVQPHPAHFFE